MKKFTCMFGLLLAGFVALAAQAPPPPCKNSPLSKPAPHAKITP
jgi:hypothetical protein